MANAPITPPSTSQAPLDPIDAFLAAPQDAVLPPLAPNAPGTPPPPGLDEFIGAEMQQEKYGGLGQQAIAAVEGAAQGLAGPLATAFETKVLGVKPEDIRGREAANPATHIASEIAGFAAPAIVSGGATAGVRGAIGVGSQAGLLTRAGELAASQVANKISKDVVREAFIGALYQGGEEVNKVFKEDPEASAGNAIMNIGLAGVAGGVFGGAAGAALRKLKSVTPTSVHKPMVSELDAPKIEAGDFATLVKHDVGLTGKERTGILENTAKWLKQEKKAANEIRTVGKEYGLPVMEGMTSDNAMIQRAEDALLTGGNTYTSLKRQEVYDRGYKAAEQVLDSAIGAPNENISKAEVGERLGASLKARIKTENEPISAMYSAIKQRTDIIPIEQGAVPAAKAELGKIPEYRVTPKSPQGQLARRIMEDLDNVQTVDDLKMLKSSIHDSLPVTASPGEKRMAAILADKLRQIEEDSIQQFALKTAGSADELLAAQALPAARKAADAAYKPFIEKVQTLAKQLGKSRVHGAQDAMNFIDNLDYEQIASRLFNKNKSEFLGFFAKEFPEEMQMLRSYQKGVMRDAAMKDGVFSPKTFMNAYNKLEPEIQASVFSKAEMKKIKDMDTYFSSFPKRYNPSGTAANINLRDTFNPMKAPINNAIDVGIEQFIKRAGATPEAVHAASLGNATVEGAKLATRAIKAVIDGGKTAMPAAVIPIGSNAAKLGKLMVAYQENPNKMLEMNDSNPVPEYQTAFADSTSRAVQYLAKLRPDTTPKRPLDPPMPANPVQKAEYERALTIAQQPLAILHYMASGQMTAKDVQTLQVVYPAVYKALGQRMVAAIMEKKEKGQDIDYRTRMQMSMFLTTPLDSSMTPESIMSAQLVGQQKRQPGNATMPANNPKRSTSGLDKLSKNYQTQLQARQASKLK